jgi:Bacteriophage T4 gp9/10-like protein
MTQQTINVGTTIGDGTGDGLHTAGQKINSNFTELYTRAPAGLSGVLAADQTTGYYRVAVITDFSPFMGVADGLATLNSSG